MNNLITCLVVTMLSGATIADTWTVNDDMVSRNSNLGITSVLLNQSEKSDSLEPRKLLIKQNYTVIPPGFDPTIIYVRMHEGISAETAIRDMTSNQSADSLTEIKDATWKLEAANLDAQMLGEMLNRAELKLGRHLADPRQGLYLHLPSNTFAVDAIRALNKSPLVEIAMPAPLRMPPPVTPPNYQPSQVYENSSSTGGIGAELVWDSFGITGQGVQVCDLEYDFNDQHCDLPFVEILGFEPVSPYGDDHGTAVIGEFASLNDGVGTTGIAHGASAVKFAGTWDGTTWDIGNAIYRAINAMPAGSIIIIEQQMAGPNYTGDDGQNGLVPIEWSQPWYNAVKVAVASGMIVCEAAGNGYQDLDAPEYSKGNGGHYPFLPENDSGAIIVGAGGAYNSCYGNTWKARLDFSNYGSRVDVQGWGECVVTTGYGNLWDEPDCDYHYYFGGTSSATPIVAGACMLVQSYAITQSKGVIGCEELRSLLEETGQPQVLPSTGHIGPLPDAYAAINTFNSIGACCNETGTCIETYEYLCENVGGNWLGLETVCVDGCLQNALGACCMGTSGGCLDNTLESTCLVLSGSWVGPKTVCADGGCEASDCDEDLDGSGSVDVGDLLILIGQWGLTDSPADINDDGVVDVGDLLIVISNWGECA